MYYFIVYKYNYYKLLLLNINRYSSLFYYNMFVVGHQSINLLIFVLYTTYVINCSIRSVMVPHVTTVDNDYNNLYFSYIISII